MHQGRTGVGGETYLQYVASSSHPVLGTGWSLTQILLHLGDDDYILPGNINGSSRKYTAAPTARRVVAYFKKLV